MASSPASLRTQQLCRARGWLTGGRPRRELIRERNLSDPNWFFQTLLHKPYLNNVIISPHFYPPTVSKSKSQCAPYTESAFWVCVM